MAVVADETAKTQTVEVVFYDFTNDETAGREVLENVSANKKSFTSDELVEYLPSGYSFENASATYDILNGCVNVAVVADEIPEEQSVEIVFYDYKNDTTVDKITIDNVNVNKKFFSRDELLKYIPGGYDFESNDVRFNIVNGFVNVAVVEKNAKTTNIKLNFYDEAAEKQIAEKDFEVAEDATHVNTGDIAKYVPEGYEITEVGDLEIRDGYVYVSVRKAAVKNIKLNFYDEAAEKQIAEKDFEVAGDATHVNTGDIAELVPEGYEIAEVGDLAIRDGYVYVSVRKAAVKNIKLNFYDEEAEKQIAEKDFEVAGDATYVNTGDIAELVPEGYEIAVVGDLEIRDGYVYVAVREVEERTVKLNFYDEAAEKQVAEVEFEVAKDATYVNTGAFETLVPAGYELAVVGDLAIRDGYVYVAVREVEARTVKLNFYDESVEKQIAEVEFEVAKDATYVNTGDIAGLVPAGYELVVVGDLEIRDGYVYVSVREVETKTVRLNFYDESVEKQIAEVEFEVAKDATYVNTGDIAGLVPAGYELVVVGDLEIRDGYVYVSVREVETKTVRLNFYDESVEKQIAEVEFEVAKDATYVNTGDIAGLVPAGYELVVVGDLEIRDGYVYVSVREVETKTVRLNFYDESVEKQIAEVEFEVAKDATYVNTGDIAGLVPAGYELVVVGDLEIRDGYVYVSVREVETKTVKINFYDEEAEKQIAEPSIEVAKDATYVNTSAFEALVPAGYELVLVGDLDIRDGYVYAAVRKVGGGNPDVDKETAVLNVTYKFGDAEVGKETVAASGKAGEAYTFGAKDLTVPAGYALAPSFEDITVEFGASKDVVVEVVEESKVFAANLYVTYKDGDVVVGHSDAVASGLVGGSYIFRIHELKVPEGYVLAEAFNGIEVPYGKTYNIVLQVKKLNPEEMADATLHISYIFNYKEIASEDITVRGKKGESYTFTSENVNLNIPSGYKLKKAMEPTEVQFGETYAITLDLTRRSSGGGSGSSGGGSGSGSGSRSVGTANKLTNGRWILDSVGWWYPFSDNTYAKGGWYYLEWQNKKDWYYFDANGYLVSGWFEENGNKYYLHDVHDGTFGRMYSGWNKIGNQWYYFNDTTTGTFGALDPNAQVPAELLNQ